MFSKPPPPRPQLLIPSRAPSANVAPARGMAREPVSPSSRACALASSSVARADVTFGARRSETYRDVANDAMKLKLAVKIRDEYAAVKTFAKEESAKMNAGAANARPSAMKGDEADEFMADPRMREASTRDAEKKRKKPSDVAALIDAIDEEDDVDGISASVGPLALASKAKPSNALAMFKGEDAAANLPLSIFGRHANAETGANIARKLSSQWPVPEWRAPWKLYRVISGHQGWVRSVALDPGNEWFVTGSADRTIKVWDLASGALKLTLTGHIEQVTGLCVSARHPYMFSCGLDKKVKCWDLEYNKVIRNYHGHLSGVYSIALHPSLDILMTGGRDSACRVWDMRTKQQVFCLTGHDNTVGSILTQDENPQLITGSYDGTIRLWDLAKARTVQTLTYHKKGVRAMAMHKKEYAFVSASADAIKKFTCHGDFMHNMLTPQKAIVNTLSMNDEDVLVSGGDDGSLYFWDYKSGHCFQKQKALVQPGSLEAECGIYASTFDVTGSRLITCEADKTIKMWKEDADATPDSHPILPFAPPKNLRQGIGAC